MYRSLSPVSQPSLILSFILSFLMFMSLSPEVDPELQVYLTSAEHRQMIISLNLIMQPKRLSAFFAVKACFLLVFNLVSIGTAPEHFLYSCFLAGWPTACDSTKGYSCPSTGLGISLCWASHSSCWLIFSSVRGCSGWQHNGIVYQPFFLILHCLQTCWGCTLFNHPGH